MRVLITGITGFVGSHLAEYALAEGARVYGTLRWRSRSENIDHIKDKLALEDCDVRDASNVYEVVKTVKPDWIFHLAAQSFVPTSWKSPAETLITNIVGALNVLEAVRKLALDCRVHIAGSSEEYGLVLPHQTPITEDNPLYPLSPYGVSKVAQDLLGFQYYHSYQLKIVRTRAFNHTGPRRGEVFVTSNFAKQIVEVEKGIRPPVIKVGNLEAKRDFTDVRDIVKAYWLALEKGVPGEVYVLASGTALSIREVLEKLLKLSQVKVKIEVDPERMRPSDVPLLVGDSSRFRKQTGWKPGIPLDKTLQDLLDYWRARI